MAPTYPTGPGVLGGTAGSGTPGTPQDASVGGAAGAAPAAPRTPGEVLTTGQGAASQASAGPKFNNDLALLYAQQALDFAVKAPLRERLIWDQFASVSKYSGSVEHAASVRKFFGDDIAEAGSEVPLVENLDVDSVTFGGRSIVIGMKEYGRAVSRTRLANVITKINIDPQIVDRIAWDGARAQDTLARAGFTAGLTNVNYYGPDGTTVIASKPAHFVAGTAATDFLTTTILQVAIAVLERQLALPFMSGNFVLLCNSVGAQHLKNERDTGGFRYVTARNEGSNGNSIYRGQIGMVEGADIVVSNRVPDGHAYLIGQDALVKAHASAEGYGAQPQSIVAPQIDKLRRFLSWGWLHYVGYSMFDTRAVIDIPISTEFRPAGAAGVGTLDPQSVVAVTGW